MNIKSNERFVLLLIAMTNSHSENIQNEYTKFSKTRFSTKGIKEQL